MDVREKRDDLISRIPGLRLGFLVLLITIAITYWFAQIVQGSHYRELAENNRLRKLPVKAARGLIYDRHGDLLVDNVPSYNLLVDQSRSLDIDSSIRYAAEILEQPVEELVEVLSRYAARSVFTPRLLAEDLSLAQVARFGVTALEHPEFIVEVSHLRLNRHGPLTAHVLGYIGEAGASDINDETGYRAGDLVGKKGVERTFDAGLRGQDGERVVVVDSRGRARDEHGSQAAEAGQPLKLSLDLRLQQEAASYFEDRAGAAVALDPRTGEILVLVSAPSYDSNLFARRLDQSQWKELTEAPHDPLQNRAIQNIYAPGSVFKIVMAIAGLTDGTVVDNEVVFCGGATKIYNRRFRCWKPSGHGWVNLREGIKESCDVYFYHMGQKLGINRIAHYARLFGLGAPTGIDIPGERGGLVPDPAWKLRAQGVRWYPGETISVAIGQGALATTPLQVATMIAIIANGGRKVEPHLSAGGDTRNPVPIGIDEDALAYVREALWAVVNEKGTGAAAKLPNVEIAGKTGTAQVIRQKSWTDSATLKYEHRDHAWFASYAPANDPELVVVAFVEHGGKGSQAAAPLAKRLFEVYFSAESRQPS